MLLIELKPYCKSSNCCRRNFLMLSETTLDYASSMLSTGLQTWHVFNQFDWSIIGGVTSEVTGNVGFRYNQLAELPELHAKRQPLQEPAMTPCMPSQILVGHMGQKGSHCMTPCTVNLGRALHGTKRQPPQETIP